MQGTTLPREMTLWLQSLNLTYKITNPKRDLSNGWVFAEILNRYYPEGIEMYQFDNGFKLDCKTNNWEHLAKFMKNKEIDVTFKDYDPVIHCAPNAAYQLLKKFYTILTGRTINDGLEPIQMQLLKDENDTMPEYAKQTITRKMKDNELQRINDKTTQMFTAQNIVSNHQNMRKTQRHETGFNNTKKTGYFAAKEMQRTMRAIEHEKAKQSQIQTIDGVAVGDIKAVTVKTANKSIRVMRQEANLKREKGRDQSIVMPIQDDESDEQAIESVLTDIISRTLTHKLNKQDPEFKVFKEHPDRGVGYFNERFQYIPDELVVDIFSSLQDHSNEIVQVLTKSMLDLPDLLAFFGAAFKNVNPMVTSKGSGDSERTSNTYNLLSLMVETLSHIANKLLNTDPQGTELFFLEYGLQELCYTMAENTFKLNEMIVLLYCFVQGTNNSHLRVLQKLADKLSTSHRSTLPHFISRLFLFENDDLSPELYQFYLEHAQRGLHLSSPVIRTKCITVLSYLSRIKLEPILPLIPILQKQQKEEYWELKGQLLILASNALVAFNTIPEEEAAEQNATTANPAAASNSAGELPASQQDGTGVDGGAGGAENSTGAQNAKAEGTASQQLATVGGAGQSSRILGSGGRNNGLGLESGSLKPESVGGGAVAGYGSQIQLTPETIEKYTPMLFSMIYTIFQQDAPKATLKIGLIYLAKIMDFYPEFTDKYLEILLNCPENIRSTTLEMDPLPGTEEEIYVSGSNTEKYRTYGAPQEWNSLFVTQALQKAVIDDNLESLEWPHIEIFDACTQVDFAEKDLGAWHEILEKLKNHFLIALCYREFSMPTIRILKKFFFNAKMQDKVILACLDIFIKMLSLLYQPDTDGDCKENVREFLELLHEGGEDGSMQTQALQDFVYQAIKAFAEENQKSYQESNLIDLMNKVVHERRGDIFDGHEMEQSVGRGSEAGKLGGLSNLSQSPGLKGKRM